MDEIATRTQHTPGPWVAKREDPSELGWCVYDDEGMLVARRLSEGNAKLIAAAPDLLAALKPNLLRDIYGMLKKLSPPDPAGHIRALEAVIDLQERAIAKTTA